MNYCKIDTLHSPSFASVTASIAYTPLAYHLSRKKNLTFFKRELFWTLELSPFCILLPTKYSYFYFIFCNVMINFSKTCEDALSLARESSLDKHGDKNMRLYFCLFYGITRFFHLKLFCKIVTV